MACGGVCKNPGKGGKKKKKPRPNRRAGKRVVNVFPFSCFFSFCSFHNEGKQSVSQNDFKTISGSVEWR